MKRNIISFRHPFVCTKKLEVFKSVFNLKSLTEDLVTSWTKKQFSLPINERNCNQGAEMPPITPKIEYEVIKYTQEQKYKILIGLTEIAGYFGNLKKGFQKIGVECTFIDIGCHQFQFGGDDEPNILVKMLKWNYNQIKQLKHEILKIPFFISAFILKFLLFIWALYHYNVFIFSFGFSFLPLNLDLPLMKIFNKKIIFTFFGSDERPPYINGALLRHNFTLEDYKKLSKKIKSNIVSVERYADYIVSHLASAHFHNKKIVHWLSIGLPFISLGHNDLTKTKTTKGISILHSPSDPIGKGSIHIRAAIEDLKKKGYDINFVEITGIRHHKLMKKIQECDFVVDQVYSDTPMAGVATEAAWFGKPAVVGGYFSDFINNYFTIEQIPPSLYCHPDEITLAIERMIMDKEFRLELGRKAQKFVRTQWTPEQVARRYLQMIKGTIPDEFMFDPNTIYYFQGYGMSECQTKELIRKIIEEYGIKSLCLSDKPELEQMFKKYVYENIA